MKGMNRSVVFAYSEVGYVCVQALLSMGAEIAALFTHRDDPNEEIWFRSVEGLALEHGIPVYTDSPKDRIELLRRLAPEMIFSFYYRRMIPMEIITAAPGGAYNMHGALLPKFRGRAPVNWAMIMGESRSGVTLHHMTDAVDAGDIVDQEAVEIGLDDTVRDLYIGITDAARLVMLRSYPLIRSGTAPRRTQDESEATYFGKRTPEDGLIDWERSAAEVYNLVRGTTHPFPGAFSNFQGDVSGKVIIWKARPLPMLPNKGYQPGCITSVMPLCAATAEGVLKLEQLQMEGYPEQNDIEFVREFNVRVGDKFGGF